jgi:uncharacterized protein (DUF1015 family)
MGNEIYKATKNLRKMNMDQAVIINHSREFKILNLTSAGRRFKGIFTKENLDKIRRSISTHIPHSYNKQQLSTSIK